MLTFFLIGGKIHGMELKTYIEKRGLTVPKLANKLNITKQHLYDILRGKAFPSRKLAAKIEDETEGAVKRTDLLYPENES